jgi:hypothetical protein
MRAAVYLVLLLAVAGAKADESDPQERRLDSELDRRFVLGIAAGLERFDTNIKIVDRSTGNSIYLDGEGSFGLPESKTVPIVYGAMRINKKHGLGFYYFRVRRAGTALAVDQDYGDLTVNGTVSFDDETSLGYLNYSYTLFDDNRTFIRALLGVYLLDLTFTLDAVGEISRDGQLVQSGEYHEAISQFAPLPLFGLDYWTRVTDKWYLGGKVAFITGTYDDVSALVVEAALRARWRMTDRTSIITGVNFMSADVDIKRTATIREISYGFEGVYLGFDFSF